MPYELVEKERVWADIAPQLYAQAAAAQWDPATAVPWDAEVGLPTEIESAVVQVMTYLVENEQAALAGDSLGSSSASGRLSLFTLLAEPDFSLASFLLSVLGEGSFLSLLAFLAGPPALGGRAPA